MNDKLKSCPDCGGAVSRRAPHCPHCGAPINESASAALDWRNWGMEYRTEAELFGWPIVHATIGFKNGRPRVAKGIIAIGQFAFGPIALAQFGVGFIFGFGQFLLAPFVIAQFAFGICFALGQLAFGYIAIGQFAVGYYALGQVGIAEFGWFKHSGHPEAIGFFTELKKAIGLGG